MFGLYVLLYFSLCILVETKKSASFEERPHFKLVKHHPCRNGKTWTEKIRFPRGSARFGARLTRDPNKKGCYSIAGELNVLNDDIRGRLYIHVAMRRRMDPRVLPDPCQQYDHSACGGTGSCLICDVCTGRRNELHKSSSIAQKVIDLSEAYVEVDGQPINCIKYWHVGRKNVRLNFCMPKKRQILTTMGVSEKFWNQFTSGLRGQAEIPLVITIRIFEEYFAWYERSAGPRIKTELFHRNGMVLEELIRRRRHNLSPYDPLAENDFYRIPFNVAVYKNNTGFIACHEIMGKIKMQ